MEPRSFKRGNPPSKSAKPLQRKALQWSHVHSNVETRQIDKFSYRDARLQWSHVHSNVETLKFQLRPVSIISFNGATFIQTWKRRSPTTVERVQPGFNGATFIQTWKPAMLALEWLIVE